MDITITYSVDGNEYTVTGDEARNIYSMALSVAQCMPHQGLEFSVFGRKITILSVD